MNFIKTLGKTVLATAALAAAVSASAVPIVGLANVGLGVVSVSNGEIDFNNGVNVAPYWNPGFNATATYGMGYTQGVNNTGSFAGSSFSGMTTMLVGDMSNNAADANYLSVGVQAIARQNFLVFAAQPGWTFSVTNLSQGTLPSTPYKLTEQNGNVSATISMNGIACDTGGDLVCDAADSKTKWVGIFSAQYTNTTIAQMQSIIMGGGRLSNNTWSGTIEATQVPEPASLALVGLALAGAGVVARRRKSA